MLPVSYGLNIPPLVGGVICDSHFAIKWLVMDTILEGPVLHQIGGVHLRQLRRQIIIYVIKFNDHFFATTWKWDKQYPLLQVNGKSFLLLQVLSLQLLVWSSSPSHGLPSCLALREIVRILCWVPPLHDLSQCPHVCQSLHSQSTADNKLSRPHSIYKYILPAYPDIVPCCRSGKSHIAHRMVCLRAFLVVSSLFFVLYQFRRLLCTSPIVPMRSTHNAL